MKLLNQVSLYCLKGIATLCLLGWVSPFAQSLASTNYFRMAREPISFRVDSQEAQYWLDHGKPKNVEEFRRVLENNLPEELFRSLMIYNGVSPKEFQARRDKVLDTAEKAVIPQLRDNKNMDFGWSMEYAWHLLINQLFKRQNVREYLDYWFWTWSEIEASLKGPGLFEDYSLMVDAFNESFDKPTSSLDLQEPLLSLFARLGVRNFNFDRIAVEQFRKLAVERFKSQSEPDVTPCFFAQVQASVYHQYCHLSEEQRDQLDASLYESYQLKDLSERYAAIESTLKKYRCDSLPSDSIELTPEEDLFRGAILNKIVLGGSLEDARLKAKQLRKKYTFLEKLSQKELLEFEAEATSALLYSNERFRENAIRSAVKMAAFKYLRERYQLSNEEWTDLENLLIVRIFNQQTFHQLDLGEFEAQAKNYQRIRYWKLNENLNYFEIAKGIDKHQWSSQSAQFLAQVFREAWLLDSRESKEVETTLSNAFKSMKSSENALQDFETLETKLNDLFKKLVLKKLEGLVAKYSGSTGSPSDFSEIRAIQSLEGKLSEARIKTQKELISQAWVQVKALEFKSKWLVDDSILRNYRRDLDTLSLADSDFWLQRVDEITYESIERSLKEKSAFLFMKSFGLTSDEAIQFQEGAKSTLQKESDPLRRCLLWIDYQGKKVQELAQVRWPQSMKSAPKHTKQVFKRLSQLKLEQGWNSIQKSVQEALDLLQADELAIRDSKRFAWDWGIESNEDILEFEKALKQAYRFDEGSENRKRETRKGFLNLFKKLMSREDLAMEDEKNFEKSVEAILREKTPPQPFKLAPIFALYHGKRFEKLGLLTSEELLKYQSQIEEHYLTHYLAIEDAYLHNELDRLVPGLLKNFDLAKIQMDASAQVKVDERSWGLHLTDEEREAYRNRLIHFYTQDLETRLQGRGQPMVSPRFQESLRAKTLGGVKAEAYFQARIRINPTGNAPVPPLYRDLLMGALSLSDSQLKKEGLERAEIYFRSYLRSQEIQRQEDLSSEAARKLCQDLFDAWTQADSTQVQNTEVRRIESRVRSKSRARRASENWGLDLEESRELERLLSISLNRSLDGNLSSSEEGKIEKGILIQHFARHLHLSKNEVQNLEGQLFPGFEEIDFEGKTRKIQSYVKNFQRAEARAREVQDEWNLKESRTLGLRMKLNSIYQSAGDPAEAERKIAASLGRILARRAKAELNLNQRETRQMERAIFAQLQGVIQPKESFKSVLARALIQSLNRQFVLSEEEVQRIKVRLDPMIRDQEGLKSTEYARILHQAVQVRAQVRNAHELASLTQRNWALTAEEGVRLREKLILADWIEDSQLQREFEALVVSETCSQSAQRYWELDAPLTVEFQESLRLNALQEDQEVREMELEEIQREFLIRSLEAHFSLSEEEVQDLKEQMKAELPDPLEKPDFQTKTRWWLKIKRANQMVKRFQSQLHLTDSATDHLKEQLIQANTLVDQKLRQGALAQALASTHILSICQAFAMTRPISCDSVLNQFQEAFESSYSLAYSMANSVESPEVRHPAVNQVVNSLIQFLESLPLRPWINPWECQEDELKPESRCFLFFRQKEFNPDEQY